MRVPLAVTAFCVQLPPSHSLTLARLASRLTQLMAVIRAKLGMLNEEGEDALDETDVVVVRKSFDARTRKVSSVQTQTRPHYHWSPFRRTNASDI